MIKHLPISRRLFEAKFRETLRTSPGHYVSLMRVETAKRLLAGAGHVKLSAVSSACGFSEPRRFRAVFRRITGMPPG